MSAGNLDRYSEPFMREGQGRLKAKHVTPVLSLLLNSGIAIVSKYTQLCAK